MSPAMARSVLLGGRYPVQRLHPDVGFSIDFPTIIHEIGARNKDDEPSDSFFTCNGSPLNGSIVTGSGRPSSVSLGTESLPGATCV